MLLSFLLEDITEYSICRNKLEELKLLIHDTHADIITIQETKLTPKAKTPKIHNFTSVRTDRLHKAGGGLITHNIQGYNITLTTSQVQEAIKQSKNNNSQGPDKLNIRHLKHIPYIRIYSGISRTVFTLK